MQLGIIGREGDRAAVSVARLIKALQRGQSPPEQDPTFGMVGLTLEARLQLIGCGGEFGSFVWACSARNPLGRRLIDSRGRADSEINSEGRSWQQAGNPYRGTDAPRSLSRVGRSMIDFFAAPIRCCEQAPGDLGSCGGGLLRNQPSLSELRIGIGELPPEHRDGSLAFIRAAAGAPYKRPQEDYQRHQNEQPGNDPKPDHRGSPSSNAARALSS